MLLTDSLSLQVKVRQSEFRSSDTNKEGHYNLNVSELIIVYIGIFINYFSSLQNKKFVLTNK